MEADPQPSCTCTYGAYLRHGGGTDWGIVTFDDECPDHGEQEEIRTKSGRLMTNDEFERLADEAEQGYDISHLIDPADAI